MTLGFLFYLPSGDGYRCDADLVAEAQRIHEDLGDDLAATTDPAAFLEVPGDPYPGRPAPRVVADLARWVNEHCDLGESGHDRFLSVSEFPVWPVKDVLHLAVPLSRAESTGEALQEKACDLGLCMVDDMEQIWVNPTGVDRGLRMRSSVGTVTTTVDGVSLRSVLTEDTDRRQRSDDGIPYVVVETGLPESPSPLAGTVLGDVRFVQAALLGNGWVVEYRTKRAHFRRQLADLDDVVSDLTSFADGDGAFLSRGWTDVTAETVQR